MPRFSKLSQKFSFANNSQSKTSVDDTSAPNGKNENAQTKSTEGVEENADLANLTTSSQEPNEEDGEYMNEADHAEVEGESIEEHKSVIMHLLSQVKIGMDLTKVVLPTFILEKRSLLEMYADFFSHCDYFLEIPQKASAEERMMACLRFYLSTFAAGRNSSVAKKPYNPILGETFQCFWDDPISPESSSTSPAPVADGPVPWSKSNQLCFIAEQISHHPPVSAFYAEHKDRKIQFNGHIWTKSKFLGLSVGVLNIGQGSIRLLDHDEEYVINFPNGYGRSILTRPWMELGGECTITCAKTAYKASIKFHTKPVYGGKLHKVSGEVRQPNSKKAFCTIEGEWHNVIRVKYLNGKTECFVDAKKSKSSKNVRHIEQQEPMESRRLWAKVTNHLKANNIEEATNEKRLLEDRQRDDAKERQQNGIDYTPKNFYKDDSQNWIYKATLLSRT